MKSTDTIPPALFVRLQRLAIPLVDDIESVLTRVLDFYEMHAEKPMKVGKQEVDRQEDANGVQFFSAAAPPSLTHTKLLSAKFGQKEFSGSALTWNAILHEAIRVAVKKTKAHQDLKHVVFVNFVFGRKEDDGYRYLSDCNLSVQGQDANNAWKGAYQIARRFQITFDLLFTWRMRDDAAYPGVVGRITHATQLHYI